MSQAANQNQQQDEATELEAAQHEVTRLKWLLADIAGIASNALSPAELEERLDAWKNKEDVPFDVLSAVVTLQRNYQELFKSAENWPTTAIPPSHQVEALELIDSMGLGYAEGRIVHVMLLLPKVSAAVARALLAEASDLVGFLLKKKMG